jgi:hypothetical protein
MFDHYIVKKNYSMGYFDQADNVSIKKIWYTIKLGSRKILEAIFKLSVCGLN